MMWVSVLVIASAFLAFSSIALKSSEGSVSENDLYIEHVGVLFVCLDVAVADLLEVNAPRFMAFLETRTCSRWLSGDMRTM